MDRWIEDWDSLGLRIGTNQDRFLGGFFEAK